MPLELWYTEASFQRVVGNGLSRVQWQLARAYLDDITVYPKPVTSSLVHVGTALTLLQNAGVALSLSQCSSPDSRVWFLWQTVWLKEMALDSENCETVSEVSTSDDPDRTGVFSRSVQRPPLLAI